MLTKQSYETFNYLSPFVPQIKGNLKKLWSYFETIHPEYEFVSVKDKQKTISYQSLSANKYIDEHLKKDILVMTNYREVTITSGKHTFHLHIHYMRKDDISLLQDALAYVLSFTALLSTHNVQTLTLTFYLLDVKRVLDNDTFFDKEEVNGGACWSSPTDCDITVWRKEEILKVTIHELIHGLSYDYKQDTTDIIKHYKDRYGITSPKMNTFEAYTEIYAELIHCYILSRFVHRLYPNARGYQLFASFVGIEHEFSRMQSSKVLHLLDINKDVNKETNVTAYYLIKTELYNDLSNFLKFCIEYNETFIKLKDVSKYLDYLKTTKKVVKKIYSNLSEYLKNTTRMTCLEADLF